MKTARVDDATLEYEITGAGEPVISIHCVFIADTFKPVLAEPALADRYRLIHYHRRGYAGSSAASAELSISRQPGCCSDAAQRLTSSASAST